MSTQPNWTQVLIFALLITPPVIYIFLGAAGFWE